MKVSPSREQLLSDKCVDLTMVDFCDVGVGLGIVLIPVVDPRRCLEQNEAVLFKKRMSVGRLGLHQAGVVNGDLASVTCHDVVPRNAHRFIRWQTEKDTPPAVSLFQNGFGHW